MPYIPLGKFGNELRGLTYVSAETIRGGTITGQQIILAGGTQGVIRSENYVAGSSGWAIFGDGSAEFQSITISVGFDDVGASATGNTSGLIIGSGGTMESSNFVSGSTGWQIDGDGNAEFNSITTVGDYKSSNWDGADPATLTSADGTATAGYYFDASEGAGQMMGDLFLGGSIDVEGTLDFTNTFGATASSMTLGAGSTSVGINFYENGGTRSVDLWFDPINDILKLERYTGTSAEPQIQITSGREKNLVLTGTGHASGVSSTITIVGSDSGSSGDTITISAGTVAIGKSGATTTVTGDLVVSDDLKFSGTSNVFIMNSDDENVMTINQDGVGFEDAATHLPNENWVEPSGMTSFSTGAWTAVTGSQITLWTHGGTNRPVEVYASATGRYRETGAVSYEVRLRVQISLDNGSTWNSPSSFAQGYVGTGAGGGGYRENMSSQLRVTGTATNNVLARVQYYVASAPDGLDHVTLYGQADMVF